MRRAFEKNCKKPVAVCRERLLVNVFFKASARVTTKAVVRGRWEGALKATLLECL